MAADKDAGTHLGASALTVRLALRLRAQTFGAARVLEQEMACMVLCWRVCGEGRGGAGRPRQSFGRRRGAKRTVECDWTVVRIKTQLKKHRSGSADAWFGREFFRGGRAVRRKSPEEEGKEQKDEEEKEEEEEEMRIQTALLC